MKKSLFTSICLLAAMVFANFSWAENTISGADSLTWIYEGGNLVAYRVKARYPKPPEGISAEVAGKIVTGLINEYTITTTTNLILTAIFPIPTHTITTRQSKLTYSNGWREENLPPTERKEKSWELFILFILMPAGGILIVSIANQCNKIGSKKLFIFYGLILLSIIVMLAGMLAGISVGLLAGISAGLLAGISAGLLAGISAGLLAGLFAGLFVGLFAGAFAEPTILKQYFIFIFLSCPFSFLISHGAPWLGRRFLSKQKVIA